VSWCSVTEGWRLDWRENQYRKVRRFPHRRYLEGGRSVAEAEAEALRQARAFREGLLRQGKIQVKRFPIIKYSGNGKSAEEVDAASLRDAIAYRQSLLKERCKTIPEEYSTCAPGGALAVPKAANSRLGFRVTFGERKRSGVQGVCWCAMKQSWRVYWQEGRLRKAKRFPVQRYVVGGRSRAEAEAAALRDAIACREHLVRKGKFQVVEKRKKASSSLAAKSSAGRDRRLARKGGTERAAASKEGKK